MSLVNFFFVKDWHRLKTNSPKNPETFIFSENNSTRHLKKDRNKVGALSNTG